MLENLERRSVSILCLNKLKLECMKSHLGGLSKLLTSSIDLFRGNLIIDLVTMVQTRSRTILGSKILTGMPYMSAGYQHHSFLQPKIILMSRTSMKNGKTLTIPISRSTNLACVSLKSNNNSMAITMIISWQLWLSNKHNFRVHKKT